jgi:hypothetical protein
MLSEKEYYEGIKAYDDGKSEYSNPYDLFSYFAEERGRATAWRYGYEFARSFAGVFQT